MIGKIIQEGGLRGVDADVWKKRVKSLVFCSYFLVDFSGFLMRTVLGSEKGVLGRFVFHMS